MVEPPDPARVAAIRARWAAATPGPWITDGETQQTVRPAPSVQPHQFTGVSFSRREDAHAIAHAPADVAWLLERLEAAEQERDAAIENGLRLLMGRCGQQGHAVTSFDEFVAIGGVACPICLSQRAARLEALAQAAQQVLDEWGTRTLTSGLRRLLVGLAALDAPPAPPEPTP